MAYSEMTLEEQIMLATGFVAMGLHIPPELSSLLGDELMADITYPGEQHDKHENTEDH